MALLRRVVLLVACCGQAILVEAGAVTPDPSSPVVVDGERIPRAEIRAARAEGGEGVAGVVVGRWIRGEARRRGVVASPASIAALERREVRDAGGEAAWREQLARQGLTLAEARARLTDEALALDLTDAVYARAAVRGPRGVLTAFDDVHRRWQSRTACLSTARDRFWALCRGDERSKGGTCRWWGEVDVCSSLRRGRSEWTILVDLIAKLFPARPIGDTDSQTADEAVERLDRALRATYPATARRVVVDVDVDDQLIVTTSRLDAARVALVLHRLARAARADERARSERARAASPSALRAVRVPSFDNLPLACEDDVGFAPSALRRPRGYERTDGTAARSLRRFLERSADDVFQPRRGWFLLARGPRTISFAHGDRPPYGWLQFKRRRGGWSWAGSGGCRPARLVRGFAQVSVGFGARRSALAPSARRIPVEVSEEGCASGRSPLPRLRRPRVVYGETTVSVLYAIRPLRGAQTCLGVGPSPTTLVLEEPLGDRKLLDAGVYPPVELGRASATDAER